jgi:hypothetical protein
MQLVSELRPGVDSGLRNWTAARASAGAGGQLFQLPGEIQRFTVDRALADKLPAVKARSNFREADRGAF